MDAGSAGVRLPVSSAGHFGRVWLALARWRLPWIAVVLLLILAAMALAPGLLAPHDPLDQMVLRRLKPPVWLAGGSWDYPLGTDALGRDVLSRVIYGTRQSLAIAGLTLGVGGALGVLAGMLAGYLGGRSDALLMRLADAMLAFPVILFAFLLAVTMGPGVVPLVIALSLEIWARFARVMRGEVLALRERNFVKLARVAGCSRAYILRVHIFPNVLGTLVVLLTLQVGWIIIMEASLSFLGAGIPPPTPTWGSMIAEGRSTMVTAWWAAVMPGLALLVTVLAFNRLGDWLRDRLDPKQERP